MTSNPELTADNFDTVTAEDRVTLVDFWAPWCGQCRAMEGVLAQIPSELEGVAVCKVNAETEEALTERFGVMGLPAFLIFRKGELKKQLSGIQSKQNLIEEIKKYI